MKLKRTCLQALMMGAMITALSGCVITPEAVDEIMKHQTKEKESSSVTPPSDSHGGIRRRDPPKPATNDDYVRPNPTSPISNDQGGATRRR